MEHLTRQQIILLALFVSFFSSIATGIVVVSLMDDTTPTVTQTINRVVEHTIERASPAAPVVVSSPNDVVDAIAKASRSVVALGVVSPGSDSEGYVSVGIIVTSSGKILARLNGGVAPGQSFFAHLSGGNRVPISFVSTDASTGISVFQADQSTDPKAARAYTPAVLGDSSQLKLGQPTAFIWGFETPTVATGIVSSIDQGAGASPQNTGPRAIVATANGQASFDSHVILVNLLGEVVGIRDSSDTASGKASFIPSNILKPYATATTLHN